MQIDGDTEERIALIADGCKISQTDAEKLYAEQVKVNPFEGLMDRAKALKQANRMRKVGNRYDGKMKGAGE